MACHQLTQRWRCKAELVEFGCRASTYQRASLKTNMVLVTHMFNIQDITGGGAAQGEIVVLRAQDKQLRVVGRIAT